MKLEYEVVDLILNYINNNSIEGQIKNIKSICFKEQVRQFEKIYKPVNPETNYLFSENDGTRLVFAKFKNKNVSERRLYKYRCKPLMINYVEQFEFVDNDESGTEEDPRIEDEVVHLFACRAEELYFDI